MSMRFEYYPKIDEDVLYSSIQIIENNKSKWDAPFFTDTTSYLDLDEIKNTINPYLNEKIKNIIVLGTGGSIQSLLAVKHLAKKKIFPITSSRAVELKACLDKTTPEDSVVIPISRGGETLDVNSTIGTFLKKGYDLIGLSSQGTMFQMLKEINCPILEVPDLSGRFAGSISNVGIVPAMLSRININAFLDGLKEGYEAFMNNEINYALELSIYLHRLYKKGYSVIFSMPYSKNLEGSVGLFVQEISESSGKDGKGLMGAYQSAPLAQHSILEYLLGGYKGAVMPIIWTVENDMPDFLLDSSIDYVNGQSAQDIVNYQADATFQALIKQGVPSAKVSLENPSEKNIGYLVSFIQTAIYKFCLLLDINWANNPKVVIGKKICNEALSNKIPMSQREQTRKSIAEEKFKDFF